MSVHVFLIAAVSADGFIAPEAMTTSTDWTSAEDKEFFRERTKKARVMVMGSTTFKTIGRPLKDRLIVVMSSKPMPDEYSHYDVSQVRYTTATPSELLQQLEADGFEEVAICGGSNVYTQFLQQKLVQTVYVTVEPILFGKGVPLLSDSLDAKQMALKNQTRLGENTVLLEYAV